MEGEVDILNSEWEGPAWESRATSLVAKAREKAARVYIMYTQHRSTNQYQPLSLKLLATVEIDGFSDLFFHSG